MKILVASILALLLGFGGQLWLRPSVSELELEATAAWNAGRAAEAERIARRILAKEAQSERAFAILEQIGQHSARPALQIAVAKTRLPPGAVKEQQFAAAGDAAMSHNLLRVAENYYSRALQADTDNPLLRHRMATISGLRLEQEGMQRSLAKWCEHGIPDTEIFMLYLSSASIDSHDASGAEDILRTCLTADSSDRKTRYALARCLIVTGQHENCDAILNDVAHDSVQATLSAMSHAIAGSSESAAAVLPSKPPVVFAADYHFVSGLIAFHQERWPNAVEGFRKAVQLRPLSRTFRSRHCEALRRAEETELEEAAVNQLETLFEIVDIAKSSTLPDASTLKRLADMCESVDAPDAALIASRCVPR